MPPHGRRCEGRDRKDGSGFKRSRQTDERLLHLGRDARLRKDLDRKAESLGVFGLVALEREEAVGRGRLPGERRRERVDALARTRNEAGNPGSDLQVLVSRPDPPKDLDEFPDGILRGGHHGFSS